jgi:hypothetical protein
LWWMRGWRLHLINIGYFTKIRLLILIWLLLKNNNFTLLYAMHDKSIFHVSYPVHLVKYFFHICIIHVRLVRIQNRIIVSHS